MDLAPDSLSNHFSGSKLKKLGVEVPLIVAPMVGISHVAFRELCRHYIPKGVQLLQFTEMLSSRRLPNENLATANELQCAVNEKLWLPQLLANEEKFIKPSIDKIMQLNPWGIDINMGCPVKHTLKHNWGVRLMGDGDYAAKVVEICKRHAAVPVSVKLRAFDEGGLDSLLGFCQKLQEGGADWLTIHARPRRQKHKGKADWQLVSQLRQKLKIPVVVNGNIQTVDDIKVALSKGPIDGLMIARAMLARPWLVWQFCHQCGYTAKPPEVGRSLPPVGPEEEGLEYLNSLLILTRLMDKYYTDENYKLEKIRFHIAMSSRWLLFGHSLWRQTTKVKSFVECKSFLKDYFSKNREMGGGFTMSQRVEW